MYDADNGIRTGCCSNDMVAPERDALIFRLRRNGWAHAQDARRLRHTRRGGSPALAGVAASAGGMLEIGVYRGKSAILMGCGLRPDERLIACDLFEKVMSHEDIAIEDRI